MIRRFLLLAAALMLVVAAPSFAYDEYLSVDDVVTMSRQGVSAEVIIAQIESTHSVFDLSTEDILELTDEGVPQSVIEAMIRTADTESSQSSEYDQSSDYSTGYDSDYQTSTDAQYRFSFALALGYYDPWDYYYPWSAYYAACYPFYWVDYGFYHPFYIYDPWFYHGRHFWYHSYPYYRVHVRSGGRHLWGRGPGRGNNPPPFYRTGTRTVYRRPGLSPRVTTRRPPVVTRPPRRATVSSERTPRAGTARRAEPAPRSGTAWRAEPAPRSGTAWHSEPQAPPPHPARSGGGDSGRHYGSRGSGGRR
jgi:hypothetical protein